MKIYIKVAFMLFMMLACLGLMSLIALSWLGIWWEKFDILSHLRLHFIVALALLALGFLALKRGKYALYSALFASFTLFATLSYRAEPAQNNNAAQAKSALAQSARLTTGKSFKILTLNTLYDARNNKSIIAMIKREKPDFIMMQEVAYRKARLLKALKKQYPWQRSCAPRYRCDTALLSKYPWRKAGHGRVGPSSSNNPISARRDRASLVWAQFGAELNHAIIASAHLRWPLITSQHAQLKAIRQTLAKKTRNGTAPLIIAGDFNAVPWSGVMKKFTAQANLNSAGGFHPTWPMRGYHPKLKCSWCFAQLQIDHILVSKHLRVISSKAGPDIGSDHLPLIAELALKPAITQPKK